MKIKDLDRNEVYSLEEIKKDNVKFDMLKKWLVENTEYYIGHLKDLDNYPCIKYMDYLNKWVISSKEPTKCALTLFELDITDYQVDCSELSEVEINNLAEIVKSKGYEVWDNESSLIPDKVNGSNNFFKYDGENYYIGIESNKTTITYDKFIELFGEKPNDWIQSDFGQYKLTEQGLVFHDDFDLELYKELGGLYNKKPIEQAKPSQYQIGIDTFTRAESNMTKDEILACVRFNLDKYTWRKKGQDKQDLEKIISYAQWGLKQLNE